MSCFYIILKELDTVVKSFMSLLARTNVGQNIWRRVLFVVCFKRNHAAIAIIDYAQMLVSSTHVDDLLLLKCWYGYLFVGARFINLQVSSLVDKWYGESQKRAEAVFSLVSNRKTYIVLHDI